MSDEKFHSMVAGITIVCGAALLAFTVFELNDCRNRDEERATARRREYEKAIAALPPQPCADTATLLATTFGSPDRQTCPDRRQHMEVQVATHPSNEEAAALVFCKCGPETAPDAGTP